MNVTRTRAATLFVGAFLALASPALAAPETEPNNDAPTANGPLTGDGIIEGAVSAGDPRDEFLVNIAPATQFGIEVGAYDPTDGDTGCVRAILRPLIGPGSFLTVSNRTIDDDTSTGAYTTGAAPLRGLLVIRPCSTSGATYKVTLTPPASLLPDPGQSPTVPFNPEPNESRETAAGPLAAGTMYQGSVDTVNDQDWVKVWVPAGAHQLSLQLFEYSGDAHATWYQDAATNPLTTVNPDDQEWGSSDVTVTGPTTLYGRVTGSPYPLPYVVRVEPADPLGVTTDLRVFDTIAPTLTFSRFASTRRTFTFFFTTNEPGTATARLYRRGMLDGSTTFQMTSTGEWQHTVTLSASDRRKLLKAHRRHKRVPFTWVLTGSDAVGNASQQVTYNFKM